MVHIIWIFKNSQRTYQYKMKYTNEVEDKASVH